jgi:hypothetical protein
MVDAYYDFNIPWSFGFNYSVNYTDNGVKKQIVQTLGLQAGLTLGKWGLTANGGFDFAKMQLTPMTVNIIRDLHCWEIRFQWIPIGMMKSYMFHIGVKSSMLQDIKYDKESSRFDNMMQ